MSRPLTLALAGALLVGGAACSDSVAPEDVAGTWNATSFVFTSVANPSTNSGNLITAGVGLTLTLNANGTLSITISEGGSQSTDSGTFTIDGSDLTLTIGGDISTGTIELNGNTLTIRLTTGVDYDFNDDGTDEPATVVIVLTRA